MTGTPSGILVVEDDAMSRDFVVRLLEGEGHGVESCEDGPSALRRLESTNAPLPALVLLDVSMPGMSGHDVLAWIRERHAAERLPVVMISAFAEETDIAAGLAAGATDYLTKPVKPPLLLARVAAALRMRRSIDELVAVERARRLVEVVDGLVRGLDGPLGDLDARLREIDDADAHAALERAVAVLDRVRGLAALRDRPLHAGLTGLVDATLDGLVEDAGDSQPATEE